MPEWTKADFEQRNVLKTTSLGFSRAEFANPIICQLSPAYLIDLQEALIPTLAGPQGHRDGASTGSPGLVRAGVPVCSLFVFLAWYLESSCLTPQSKSGTHKSRNTFLSSCHVH